MKKTRRPIWGPSFSLLVTVISDKPDQLSELSHVKCITYLALLLEIRKRFADIKVVVVVIVITCFSRA